MKTRSDLPPARIAPAAFATGTALVGLALPLSALGCHDLSTWFMETVPVMVALPLLWAMRARFALTPLLFWLVVLHCLVLIVGGHYTYAEVPVGFWLRDALGLARNHYDRFGHFMQGLVPALLAREILRRRLRMPPGAMLTALCVSVALAVSAIYEIIEMIAGRVSAEGAAAFLGTQGDAWDTQMDMTLAWAGALFATLVLARLHDRQLAVEPLRTE
ncbi:DUF2238 domain-containing protein [Derxia gummosa]|uniref:DUF2238 domain-containing protein n=1 Tax=Derxia gummosa DSM 723 TaxID=1121388 RepID=A0A8B6XBI7_9BURK|nr:DUF2238 domain-containing protein [Derxia gummosa]